MRQSLNHRIPSVRCAQRSRRGWCRRRSFRRTEKEGDLRVHLLRRNALRSQSGCRVHAARLETANDPSRQSAAARPSETSSVLNRSSGEFQAQRPIVEQQIADGIGNDFFPASVKSKPHQRCDFPVGKSCVRHFLFPLCFVDSAVLSQPVNE